MKISHGKHSNLRIAKLSTKPGDKIFPLKNKRNGEVIEGKLTLTSAEMQNNRQKNRRFITHTVCN